MPNAAPRGGAGAPRAPAAVSWRCVPFAALTADDVYAVLRLRSRVFVVEQACPFLDPDGRDPAAWHLTGTAGGSLVAYARLFAPGVVYAEASIGRVVTDPAARRTGAGRALMAEAVRALGGIAPGAPIRIGAQRHLERFYAAFGFVSEGEEYLEDGIWHVEMVRPAGGAPNAA